MGTIRAMPTEPRTTIPVADLTGRAWRRWLSEQLIDLTTRVRAIERNQETIMATQAELDALVQQIAASLGTVQTSVDGIATAVDALTPEIAELQAANTAILAEIAALQAANPTLNLSGLTALVTQAQALSDSASAHAATIATTSADLKAAADAVEAIPPSV